MSEHIQEWLSTYHDGELRGKALLQVETHLRECADCRAELQALQSLSSVLKSAPAPELTPPGLFAAQVALRLPRRAAPRPPAWKLGAPLALIGIWAFVQAGLKLAAFVLTADWLLDFHWIETESLLRTTVWLTGLNLGLLVVTVILWAGWMGLWVAWERHQAQPAASKA
jgi:predicted anti-sigma-YlaC factor YlaD